MKRILVSVTLLVVVKVSYSASIPTATTTTDLEPKELACINEKNFEATKLKEINTQEIVPEDNSKFSDFLGCYWQKKGWLNPTTGKIEYHILKASQNDLLRNRFANEKRVISNYLPQIVWSAVVECEHRPPPKTLPAGQKAVKVQNCIMKEVKEESKSYLNLQFPIPNH